VDFRLTYSGSPGDITAILRESGSVVATASGLKDGRAARRFASRAARDYKAENTPAATEYEAVVVEGSSTFTL
jgi:hypothetical protein